MKYLIKNTNLNGEKCDIALIDGLISEIGSGISQDGFEVLDGSKTIALQGLVDLHTHLREPGKEDAETVASGSAAAANATAGLYFLTTAITANTTTTTAPVGSLATTTNATGTGKLFISDGTKWQYPVVA